MITPQQIKSMKSKQKIAVLTAYDFPTAKLMDGIVDMILVGDSLGMVVLGYENTTKVTMDDMLGYGKPSSAERFWAEWQPGRR